MKFYDRARKNRLPLNHPSLRQALKTFLKASAINFVYLQLLFLVLFSYLFGSLFQQTPHTHNLNVLYVDYDHGVVGEAIRKAYSNLQNDAFPTLVERHSSDFATPHQLKQEVCDTRYWAALYTSPGASNRLQATLSGNSATYDKADVLSYVWNEARYPVVVDTAISANLEKLSSEARIMYAIGNWTAEETIAPATFSVFADPWKLNSINIQPTTQGSRLIYNSLVILLVLNQDFFYLGTLNSLFEAFKLYARLDALHIIIYRNLVAVAYTFISSLCTAGAIWAFRAGWNVNGNQFVLTWAIMWLFAHANFITLDVFSVWLPPPFVPMALVTWIVLNVTSVLLPFELSPAFYRWAYAMPAHEVFQVLIDIWSGGCNPTLHYALPILFAYEVSSFILGSLGILRRAHYASIKEEAEQTAFQARIDTTLAFVKEKEEQDRNTRNQQKRIEEQPTSTPSRSSDDIPAAYGKQNELDDTDRREREELRDVMEHGDREMERIERETSRDIGFGPAFGFAFGSL